MIPVLIQARKSIPIDRLEHLRSQLSSSTHPELCVQLEEVISKLEPLDSASSSRRSSISSHVSYIYSLQMINCDLENGKISIQLSKRHTFG